MNKLNEKNRTSIALLVSLQFILKNQYQKRGHKVEDSLKIGCITSSLSLIVQPLQPISDQVLMYLCKFGLLILLRVSTIELIGPVPIRVDGACL